ncbi:hypothetical protein [Kitasatospora viridis]|nr:hypothetical protein [Kitasatospora viridis]
MSAMDEMPEGRTHWRRRPAGRPPALLAAGGIGSALAGGALASGLLIQSGAIQLTTSSLYGTHYAAALVDQPYETATGTTGTAHPCGWASPTGC